MSTRLATLVGAVGRTSKDMSLIGPGPEGADVLEAGGDETRKCRSLEAELGDLDDPDDAGDIVL